MRNLQPHSVDDLERQLRNVARTVEVFEAIPADEMDSDDEEILLHAFRFQSELVGELKSRRKMSVVRDVLEVQGR